MNLRKFLLCSSILLIIAACNHPIVVNGQGDVTSAFGSHNCHLEDYRAGGRSWSYPNNTVINAYQTTYHSTPISAWECSGWEGCQAAQANACGFYISQSTVVQA